MSRPTATGRQDPYAVFRPVGGRVVPLAVAVVSVLVFALVAALLPARSAGVLDRVLIAGIGLAIAALMWRFAQVRAIPSPQGLEVHNLLLSRRVDWAQVVDVQFGGGAPWVVLELNDFETLAVMGVQRSDGPRAQREAERLAALVQAHTQVPGHPG